MRRAAWVLCGVPIFIYGIICLFVVGFTVFQDKFENAAGTKQDIIVVLGAGMDADGTLHKPSILRVQKAVILFQSGVAPKVHFTGGRAKPDGPSAGQMMAKLAVELGLPTDVFTTEDNSLSTLQNALFSQPALKGYTRIVLVTEGFHLARAWAIFHWAARQSGQDVDITLVNSTRFRHGISGVVMVLREGLAWGSNLARLSGWYLAPDNSEKDAWLN